MLLIKLTVTANYGLVREIIFKPQGVNLITSYANNVGKTTLLRAVDYCFGSKGGKESDFYTDKEFGTTNEIKDYLQNNEVTFALHLRTDDNNLFVLKRKFNNSGSETFWINDEEYNGIKEYTHAIGSLLFKVKNNKPSARKIMPKFIRKDEDTKHNILKYLNDNTKKDEYEALRLYLFGFADKNLLVEKLELGTEIRKLENKLRALETKRTLSQSKEALKLIEREIQTKEKELANFQLDEAYDKQMKQLKELRGQVIKLNNEIGNLELKLALNQETLMQLRNNKSDIDMSTIRDLYDEASAFFPTIQKKFEEIVVFHNQVISKKMEFVEIGLREITKQVKESTDKRNEFLKAEKTILTKLEAKGSFADLNVLRDEVYKLHQRKGEESNFIKIVEDFKKSLQTKKEKMNVLEDRIKVYRQDFENNITLFNTYFVEYSKVLYNEEYYIFLEEDFSFNLGNMGSNVGEGKKKAQITAFDLAYIAFVNDAVLDLPKFVLHDSIEDIDSEKIEKLFDIADSLNGQYIVSVLESVLKTNLSNEFIEAHTILKLHENDKFFRKQ